ncbi:MAG: bis(5'-nucleosyl)-tetraphosphatase [Candidatus Bathyarchaeia archaeon]
MRENSSGIIVYRKENNQRLYLLLHYQYKGDYWDFPRGNIREGETPIETALRETEEETGLSPKDLRIIEGFKEHSKWFYSLNGQTVFKTVTYFLAETGNADVKVSEEHVGARWVNYSEALNLLKYKNSKRMLQKAESFLKALESLSQ